MWYPNILLVSFESLIFYHCLHCWAHWFLKIGIRWMKSFEINWSGSRCVGLESINFKLSPLHSPVFFFIATTGIFTLNQIVGLPWLLLCFSCRSITFLGQVFWPTKSASWLMLICLSCPRHLRFLRRKRNSCNTWVSHRCSLRQFSAIYSKVII